MTNDMTKTRDGWLDRVINVGMIALVGGSIAVALAVGAAIPAGSTQGAMPMSEWRPAFDQGIFHASFHAPRTQRLFSMANGPVGNAPVGQGWG